MGYKPFIIMKFQGTFVQTKKQKANQTTEQQNKDVNNVSFVPTLCMKSTYTFKAKNNMLLPIGCEIGGEYLIDLNESMEHWTDKVTGEPKSGMRLKANVVSTNQKVIDKIIDKMEVVEREDIVFGADVPATAQSNFTRNTPPPIGKGATKGAEVGADGAEDEDAL